MYMLHYLSLPKNQKIWNIYAYAEKPVFKCIKILNEDQEHRIRELCNGKKNSLASYEWKWLNEEETLEFSKKYSHK